MTAKKIEQTSLLVGILVNLLMSCAGILVYRTTHIEALFVDAYFSMITFFSAIVSLIVSKLSSHRNKMFPGGFFVLEPLYSLFQSVLTVVLLSMSLVTVGIKTYAYFAHGEGSVLDIGPVLPYEMVMILLSWGLSYFYKKQNQKIHNLSTMLFAETQGTFVDGMMSLGIGAAAFILFFIQPNSALGFLRYTGDFFITLLLVMLTIKMPLKVIKSAFGEISGKLLLNPEIRGWIDGCLKKHPLQDVKVQKYLVYKVGMSVKIYVFLDAGKAFIDSGQLSQSKAAILKELSKRLEFVHLAFCLS
ncbi:cation transporter [Oenococcus kitaharae]|uniref:Cobalt-zinc-cadmium resistance protein n=1 Tax=Oenococcus kitaharae DSM 17330 TaxID=1045004 RepID=G9WFC1_9LACO|nr:cation transporter [Oenococcus kitaharae]EHN58841.1 Cobalt-zinc-cadmium resistance protein [Oenococcus kitaharae DSM 17330]OEY81825.1 cobalt transporter [Oenococcus kitaharae]OEY84056.1 cobalt transporter [Oenococcus kitaharae]OEY85586.1 cobalt transporter [Oenococcus kitaharae]